MKQLLFKHRERVRFLVCCIYPAVFGIIFIGSGVVAFFALAFYFCSGPEYQDTSAAVLAYSCPCAGVSAFLLFVGAGMEEAFDKFCAVTERNLINEEFRKKCKYEKADYIG